MGTAAPVVITSAMPIGKWEPAPLDVVAVASNSVSVPEVVSDLPIDVIHSCDTAAAVVVMNIHNTCEVDGQLRLPPAVDVVSSDDSTTQQLVSCAT